MASENQKLKLFHLARILEEETDEEHGLTREQITDMLTQLGIKVERKTFYDDIKCLKRIGYDIVSYNTGASTQYSLASREFEDAELLLLADAIHSSKFLTKTKASALIRKIAKHGSKHLDSELKKKVFVEGRIRNQNESVFYNLDAIHTALARKRKVSFLYFKYDTDKKPALQHNGERYLVTPVQLMYMDDFYYLIAYSDKHEGFTTYRLDRMRKIETEDEPATKNDKIASFDVSKFQQRVFGMFSGEAVDVVLRVDVSIMSSVIDRFGKEVTAEPSQDGSHALVYATVMQAPTFYGWLATFGDKIVIEEPASLREGYRQHLEEILSAYASSGSQK